MLRENYYTFFTKVNLVKYSYFELKIQQLKYFQLLMKHPKYVIVNCSIMKPFLFDNKEKF